MGFYYPALPVDRRHGPGRVVTDEPRTPGPTRGPCRGGPTMTKDAWRKSATTDVLFPDDLEGYGPIQVVGEPIDAADTDTDTVQYGQVAQLDGDHHDAKYVVTPKQLRAAIADAWRVGDGYAALEVLSAEKAGPADDAEWQIEARSVGDGDPL